MGPRKKRRDHNSNKTSDEESDGDGSSSSSDFDSNLKGVKTGRVDKKKTKARKGTRADGSCVYEEFTDIPKDPSRVICKHCKKSAFNSFNISKYHQ